MKIQGTYRFAAPRPVVWQALLDPEVLVRTLPGCERLERESESRFVGALLVAIGPVKGTFKGHLELFDLDPPNGYRMKLEGAGQPGQMSGEGTIRLADDGDGTNLSYDLDAKIGGKIAGVGQRLLDASAKVITRQGLEGLEAQLRARVPASAPTTAAASAPAETAPATSAVTATEATESAASTSDATGETAGVATAARNATAKADPPAPAPARTTAPASLPPPPAAPSTTTFAARFLVGLIGELIPPERRVLAASIAGIAVLLGVVLLLRACG